MSTDYVSNKPIKLSELVEIISKVEGFKLEIERGDVRKKTNYMEPITSSSVLEESRYRISLTKKPSPFEIQFLKKEDKLTTNYLWVYVNEDLECHFCRYGSNDVSSIISLIEFHTSLKLFDEHTYFEMCDEFGLEEEDFELEGAAPSTTKCEELV